MRLSLLAILCCCFVIAAAQDQPLHACGTYQGRSAWLQEYQAAPQAYYKGGDTTMYVAMTIHIIGTDQGNGYFNRNTLIESHCRLNELFAQANIEFVIEGDINYINNSSYYQHATVREGAEMMFANNVDGTLNVYFVDDPAGNCGYNLPYAGIANAKNCSSPFDATWAHEVGHALSLPHPFLGWEGGISWDGSVDHNFSDPAPTRVTYNYTDFQSTYYPQDTLIIDTAFVELVDRSNCDVAADGFCDTQSDYLARRWTCNTQGISGQVQTDPDGVTFQSPADLIMNYSSDNCQHLFSNEQIGAMRAFLINQRNTWLRSNDGSYVEITDNATALMPESGTVVSPDAVRLNWDAVAGATNYVVQVSRVVSFNNAFTTSYYTSEPNIELPEVLLEDRTYYWRVKPFSNASACTNFSDINNFLTDIIRNTSDPLLSISDWGVYPQPLKSDEAMTLWLKTSENWQGQASLHSITGQQLWQSDIAWSVNQRQTTIQLPPLVSGLYLFRLQDADGQETRKLIIE